MRFLGSLRLSGLLLASVALLPGQCVMCRTAAAAQAQTARTINTAILILLVPAMALFGGVFMLVFRSAPGGEDEAAPRDERVEGGHAG